MAGPNARRNTTIIAGLCYFIALPFLILVLIGNTHNSGILDDIYFFKIDVSHIIPISVDNSNLLNSVARSLGLHDFYQVGLWNFCEGYNDEGITDCSKPVQFFWFNPVEVLVSELLAGATIALPSQVVTILKLLKLGEQIMFACFMAGTVLNFVLLLLTPLVLLTRWFSLCLSLLAAVTGLVLTVAAIIATVISVAAKIAVTAQDQLNIEAEIGIKMFIFMWIGALLPDLAFLLHAAMGCCCAPNRRAKRSQKGYEMAESAPPADDGSQEKQPSYALPKFVRRRKATS